MNVETNVQSEIPLHQSGDLLALRTAVAKLPLPTVPERKKLPCIGPAHAVPAFASAHLDDDASSIGFIGFRVRIRTH